MEGSWVQVTPPSVDWKMPAPRTASALKKPSPVLAYMTFGLACEITMLLIDRLPAKSFTGVQLAPPLTVFQMPPATLPAHMVPATVGWIAMARTRPPMLPGPSAVHWPGPMPATGWALVPARAAR